MLGVYSLQPDITTSKDNIDELLNDIVASRDKLFDDFYRHIDNVYFSFVYHVPALEGQMETLKLKVDSAHRTIKRQQDHRTRGEKAIKSFVGTWFEMSKEDVNTCFLTSSHLPSY